MRVRELWRYPVKSVGGERLAGVDVGAGGLAGDRRWALTEADGAQVTARRDPVLLACAASIVDPELVVVLPDGAVLRARPGGHAEVEAGFGALLGRTVRLVDSGADPDLPGLPDDPADSRVSLVSSGTLGAEDPRRFRSNVVLDGAGEDGLVGARVVLGGAGLAVRGGITRCVMVTREQPGLARDTSVLARVNRERGGLLAVGAVVTRPGRVAVGDELRADPAG